MGGGGNPHAHGFSLGLPGPRVGRVRADVEGEDDMPPSTVSEDAVAAMRWLWEAGGAEEWESRGDLSRRDAAQLLRGVLVAADGGVAGGEAPGTGVGGPEGEVESLVGVAGAAAEGRAAGDGPELGATGSGDGRGGDDEEGEGAGADALVDARVRDVLEYLVEDGS